MAIEGMKRKLTAILSADVKDFSRLMSQDEVGTIKALNAHREVISSFVQQYKGRVVDTPGDNILTAFESVSNAVNCAVEIQRELAERNAEVPSARMMQWRIGISLGDVVEEDGRIYGDRVNIAARVEGLAEPGGICISGTVHDQVKNKLGLEYESLGEQDVKNIPEPVHVYRVLSYPGAAAHRVVKAKGDVTRRWHKTTLAVVVVALLCIGSVVIWNYISRPGTSPVEVSAPEKTVAPVEKSEPSLSEKPSIAVLPFENMSGDPEQGYFSDGMTEEIINLLSKSPQLFVIARNSTFTYKGKPVKVQQVGRELGAKYVLEGSVRKAGNRIRITAQLVDAITGNHIWSERYDRELEDIFALQDEIAQQIAVNLIAEHEEVELSHSRRIPTGSLGAYDLYWRGMEHFYRFTMVDNKKAREIFESVIKIDPAFVQAYASLGQTYNMDNAFGWYYDAENIEKMYEMALKAISLDETYAPAHGLISSVYANQQKIDQAIAEGERALSLDPNDAYSYMNLGRLLGLERRYEEGIELLKKSLLLNPLHRAYALANLGQVYNDAGRYKEAISSSNRAIIRDPKYWPAYSNLFNAYSFGWFTQQNHDPKSLDHALESAQKVVSLDNSTLYGHAMLSMCYVAKKRYDDAIAKAESLIAIAPDNSIGYTALASIYNHIGKPDEAILLAEKANLLQSAPGLRLSTLLTLGQAYRLTGSRGKAIETYKQVFAHKPTFAQSLWIHTDMAILYSELGNEEEAGAEAAEVLKLVPHFSVEIWGQRNPTKDQTQIERDMAALRKAGLK